jgi:hypothetical protein
MARMPILFKLKDPFQARGFLPIVSNGRPAPPAATGSRLLIPTDLAALFGWYTANDAATFNSGSTNTWAPEGGVGPNLTQATAGDRPTYSSGPPTSVDFGSTDVLNLAGAPSTGWDAIAIVTSNSSTADYRTLLYGPVGGSHFLIMEVGSNRIGSWAPGFSDSGYTLAPSTQALLRVRQDASGNLSISLNGAALVQTVATYPITQIALIGNDDSGNRNFGKIHALTILNGNDNTQAAQAEGSLAWEWGLQGSLDAGHAYKSAAPTVSGSSPDVTVALTGQALTAAQDSTVATSTLAVTGQSVTAAQGSVLQGAPLTGQTLTIAQGSVTQSISVALTGQSLSAAQGTLSPTNAEALSGQALTIAQGSVVQSSSIALSGQAAVVARGSVTPTTSPALTGLSVVVSRGSVNAGSDATAALTGQSLSAAQGSVTPSTSPAISGQGLTAAAGTLAPARSLSLSGQSIVVGQGTVTAVNADVTLALTGQALSAAQGALPATLAPTVAGQSLASAQGAVAAVRSLLLSGLDLTIAQTTIATRPSVTYPLAGIEQPYPGDASQTYPLAGNSQQYPLAS